MSDARDELVDVIAKGIFGAEQCDRLQLARLDENWESRLNTDDQAEYREMAHTVLAALVSRYGEPEIEDHAHVRPLGPGSITTWVRRIERRLVFPWQTDIN